MEPIILVCLPNKYQTRVWIQGLSSWVTRYKYKGPESRSLAIVIFEVATAALIDGAFQPQIVLHKERQMLQILSTIKNNQFTEL